MATAGISLGQSLLKLGMGLLAAHDLRYKDALNENAAVVQAVGVFDNDLQSIFAALNAGTISESEAEGYLQQLSADYWNYVGQYQGKPGVASVPCGPQTGGPPGHGACGQGPRCDKTCTAGCCVGCQSIEATIQNALYVIQAGGGSFNVCTVYPSTEYRNPGRPSYSLTYVKPDIAAGTLGSVEGFLNLLGGKTTPQGSVGLHAAPASISKYATLAIVGLGALLLFRKVL